jgi:hypothetical protein
MAALNDDKTNIDMQWVALIDNSSPVSGRAQSGTATPERRQTAANLAYSFSMPRVATS